MNCYQCQKNKDVLYPALIKIAIPEQSRENCKVSMLYETWLCRDCQLDNKIEIISIRCPDCKQVMNLWNDGSYRCPFCFKKIAL